MYRAQGVLSIRVEKNESSFLFAPSSAYLSPDKEYMVMYNLDGEQDKAVLLKELSKGYVKLSCVEKMECRDVLVQIALQQRLVELLISGAEIVGFTYPILRT